MIELTNTRPKGDKNEELTDKTSKEESVDTLPKGDEEIKEKTKVKILTPNKLLARLATLLAQIKYGYNSQKLENINFVSKYKLSSFYHFTKYKFCINTKKATLCINSL